MRRLLLLLATLAAIAAAGFSVAAAFDHGTVPVAPPGDMPGFPARGERLGDEALLERAAAAWRDAADRGERALGRTAVVHFAGADGPTTVVAMASDGAGAVYRERGDSTGIDIGPPPDGRTPVLLARHHLMPAGTPDRLLVRTCPGDAAGPVEAEVRDGVLLAGGWCLATPADTADPAGGPWRFWTNVPGPKARTVDAVADRAALLAAVRDPATRVPAARVLGLGPLAAAAPDTPVRLLGPARVAAGVLVAAVSELDGGAIGLQPPGGAEPRFAVAARPGDVAGGDPVLLTGTIRPRPGEVTPATLLVIGDPAVTRLEIRAGTRRLEVRGRTAVVPATELGDGDELPPLQVTGFTADGSVVPAWTPATGG